jgi:putative transposase
LKGSFFNGKSTGRNDEKILSLYACGMSQYDISEQIKNLYDVEISPKLVSKISEKIMPDVTA